MANTLSSKTYRDKYRLSYIDTLLKNALVAEKICLVDRSDAKTINSPYGSEPTVVVQAISGNYTPADYTTTDDTLVVSDEFIVSEHIYDFEQTLSKFDLFSSRVREQAMKVAEKIDYYVINSLTDEATGAYTTPIGGFSSANIPEIMSSLISMVTGYADAYKGLYLVIENTDVPGFIQTQVASGFSFADSALKNGFMTSYMGVDIYVKRSGTFADDTIGTKTVTNNGHRVFGVKNVATYASPRGVRFEEKEVSGKTGKEIVTYGYIGFKLWAPKSDLTVDITLA